MTKKDLNQIAIQKLIAQPGRSFYQSTQVHSPRKDQKHTQITKPSIHERGIAAVRFSDNLELCIAQLLSITKLAPQACPELLTTLKRYHMTLRTVYGMPFYRRKPTTRTARIRVIRHHLS